MWLKSSLESVLLCFRIESEAAVMVSDAFFLNKLFESCREVFSTEARILQFGKAMRAAVGKDVEDVRIQMRRTFEECCTLKAYVTLCTVGRLFFSKIVEQIAAAAGVRMCRIVEHTIDARFIDGFALVVDFR